MGSDALECVKQLFCTLRRARYERCVVCVRQVVERLILAVKPGQELAVSGEFLVHVVHDHAVDNEEEVW